jgi:1,2-phenylacetyl-CoA epoxidase catalytic subunit
MDCMQLAQATDQWHDLVNMVMNFVFHKVLEMLLIVKQQLASHEDLGSMDYLSSFII